VVLNFLALLVQKYKKLSTVLPWFMTQGGSLWNTSRLDDHSDTTHIYWMDGVVSRRDPTLVVCRFSNVYPLINSLVE
jgi:hypothetical protein